jgi:hypothetical protein
VGLKHGRMDSRNTAKKGNLSNPSPPFYSRCVRGVRADKVKVDVEKGRREPELWATNRTDAIYQTTRRHIPSQTTAVLVTTAVITSSCLTDPSAN